MKSKKTKRIRKVTRYPKWILKLIGIHHGKQGLPIVEEQLRKWEHKLATFENEYMKEVENELFSTREKAAKALQNLSGTNAELSVPDKNFGLESGDPKNIRMIRNLKAKAFSAKNTTISKNAVLIDEIIRFNETIISSNVDIVEHFDCLRNHYHMCVSSYLAGVRKNIPDYQTKRDNLSNQAFEIYEAKHRVLDEEIRRVAYSMINKNNIIKEGA